MFVCLQGQGPREEGIQLCLFVYRDRDRERRELPARRIGSGRIAIDRDRYDDRHHVERCDRYDDRRYDDRRNDRREDWRNDRYRRDEVTCYWCIQLHRPERQLPLPLI